MKHNIQINSIFYTDKNGYYTKKASLYQDIIRYSIVRAVENPNTRVFKHREIAKWLIRHNREFINRFKDPSTRNITISNRIEDTQRLTKACLDDMISLGIIRKVGTVKQEKGTGNVDLYEYTMYATFIAYIIDASAKQNTVSIDRLFEIINSFGQINQSYALTFIIKFFNKCIKNQSFTTILRYFLNVILPSYVIHDARQLVQKFMGISNILNWILADPESFLQTVEEINDIDERRILFFQFKMEIEDYYDKNPLTKELTIAQANIDIMRSYYFHPEQDYTHTIIYPGNNWRRIRCDHIADDSRVVILTYCHYCNSDQAFLIGVLDYLRRFLGARRVDFTRQIGGNCVKCGKYIVGSLMEFEYYNMSVAWDPKDLSKFLS